MFEKIQRWIRYNLMYFSRPPWDTGVSPPELRSFLDGRTAGRALDVGCGTGNNLLTKAKYGWNVAGIDIAWLSVLRAKAKLKQEGFRARVQYGDVTGHLDFYNTFDLVLDIGCYHSLSQNGRAGYLQNLRKWLDTGGTYLMYAHLRTQPQSGYGINDEDVQALTNFLDLQWRDDSSESRPDGGGGRPATWMAFTRKVA